MPNWAATLSKRRLVSGLFDIHFAHAHDRIEQNMADARDALDLAQTKAKGVYEPLKQAIAAQFLKRDATA